MSTAQPITASTPNMTPELRERVLRRVADTQFAGRFKYWQSPDMHGSGVICNLGRGELCLRLPKFIEPGKNAYIQLDCLRYQGQLVDLTARIDWCRNTEQGDCFIAMGRMIQDRYESGSARYVTYDSVTQSQTTVTDSDD